LSHCCIIASLKLFQIIGSGGGDPTLSKTDLVEEAYQIIGKVIKESFPEGKKIGISEMLKWVVETLEL
jgi:hypothetical protein